MIVEGTTVSTGAGQHVVNLHSAGLLSPAGCMQPPPIHLRDLEKHRVRGTCAAQEPCVVETSTMGRDNIRGVLVRSV